jgi:hypothetical protein
VAIKKHIWWSVVLALSIVFIAAGVLFIEKIWIRHQNCALDKTKALGDELVTAIGEYHAEHGVYPHSLSDLVPDYISNVEQPVWGLRKWDYRLQANGKFLLSVSANKNNYPILFREGVDQGWYYDN